MREDAGPGAGGTATKYSSHEPQQGQLFNGIICGSGKITGEANARRGCKKFVRQKDQVWKAARSSQYMIPHTHSGSLTKSTKRLWQLLKGFHFPLTASVTLSQHPLHTSFSEHVLHCSASKEYYWSPGSSSQKPLPSFCQGNRSSVKYFWKINKYIPTWSVWADFQGHSVGRGVKKRTPLFYQASFLTLIWGTLMSQAKSWPGEMVFQQESLPQPRIIHLTEYTTILKKRRGDSSVTE